MDIKRILDRIDKLEDKVDVKLDRLDQRVDSLDKTVAVYNEQLKLHIEGTVQNREALQVLRDEFKPVQKHVELINAMSKVVAALAFLATLALTIKQLAS